MVSRLAIRWAGFFAKCRNPMFLRIAGATCGLFCLYASWAAFEHVFLARFQEGFDGGLFDVVMQPDVMWQMAVAINEEGWYSIQNVTPSRTILWAFWLIEALIIVGVPAYFGAKYLDNEVFCEESDSWYEAVSEPILLFPPDDDEDFDRLTDGDLEVLEGLDLHSGEGPYLSIDLRRSSASDTGAYRTTYTECFTSNKGDFETQRTPLTGFILVSLTDWVRLESLTQPASTTTAMPQTSEAALV